MKAIISAKYGLPEVLVMREIDKPEANEQEIRINFKFDQIIDAPPYIYWGHKKGHVTLRMPEESLAKGCSIQRTNTPVLKGKNKY